MPRVYTTKDGDVLDIICYRAYAGRQSGAVELVLGANYATGLAELGPILPRGLKITLPDLPTALSQKPLVKLWD